MFLALFLVLVVCWVFGFVVLHVASGLIHLLLIVAAISLICHLVRPKDAVTEDAIGLRMDAGLQVPSPRSLDWQNKTVGLKYPFAGRQLGVVRFAGRVLTNAWSAIDATPHDEDATAQLSEASVAQ